MDDILDKLETTLEALDRAMTNSQQTATIVSGVLEPILTRIDKIVVAAGTASDEGKNTSAVALDELLKLRKDVMMQIVSAQQPLLTQSGQKSGLAAAVAAIKESEEQLPESTQTDQTSDGLERTKKRIQDGDLKFDRPRKSGARPETLKNIRQAQEEITKEKVRDTLFAPKDI